jgi:acyl-CoA thioester hydrolase
MPLTHVRTFRVRYYECDAYERLRHSNYARYMQEAAFDASAAAGYDLSRYAAMERYWLVRETDIEYLRPVRYGDALQVKTWVDDFRRVRSRRMYEFRMAGSGELVARAYSDWAFLHNATGRPAIIPPEMAAAFFPEGAPARPRSHFPAPPSPPAHVLRLARHVEWQDIDAAQHVNNAMYLDYVEDCAMRARATYGWPLARLQAEGAAITIRRHQIEYRQPALLDDELELASWLSSIGPISAVRHCTIRRLGDDQLLAQAHTLWEWIDVNTRQSAPIPDAFLKDLAPNMTSDPDPWPSSHAGAA